MARAEASSSSARTLPPQLRKLVLQTFTKKYSLQLHASALSFIADTLAEHELLHVVQEDDDQVTAQREAIEVLAKGCLDLGVLEEAGGGGPSAASIITAKQLQHVYSQLIADGQTAGGSSDISYGGNGHHHAGDSILDEEGVPPAERWMDVIDAFEMPRVQWDPVNKTYAR